MIEQKKTGADRTQPATRDEFWTDERVRSFLDMQAPEGMPVDYHILQRAYRGMLPDTFARFVAYFVAAGRDLNIRLSDQSTFLDHVRKHRRSEDYLRVLEEASAVSGNEVKDSAVKDSVVKDSAVKDSAGRVA